MAIDLVPGSDAYAQAQTTAATMIVSVVWDPYGEPRGIVAGELDATTTALRRIYKVWSQKPNWVALVTVIGNATQFWYDEQWQVANLRSLSTAFGSTLDEIGALVGLARQDLEQEVYRRGIRARGISTIGDAGIDAVMAPAKAILGPDGVSYAPSYPRAFCYIIHVAVDAEMLALLVRILTPVPGAGIGAKLLLSPADSPGWDWSTPQAWAASWASAYGAVDASVVSPWSWSVAL